MLKENPFYILDVTLDDSLEIINEKCEDKAFMDEENEQMYQDARQILSSPVKRLSAEVRWFYNLGESVSELINEIDASEYLYETEFESLEYNHEDLRERLLINVERLKYVPYEYVANFIKAIDEAYSAICDEENIESYIREINSHRKLAGIPLCNDFEIAKKEILNLINDIVDALNQILSDYEETIIIEIANDLLGFRFNYGVVTDKFVNLYAVKFDDVLNEYKGKILHEIEEAVEYDEEYELEYLCNLTREFDHIAQPIQLLLESHGQSRLQKESVIVANEIRDLAIFYNNDKELPRMALHLLNLEMELFPELPDIYSKLKDDKKILDRLVQKTAQDSYMQKRMTELDENVIHDESSVVSNSKYLKPRFPEYIESIINYVVQVTSKTQEGTEEYRKASYRIALFYHTLACDCTWSDMWEEALETYNQAVNWAEKTEDADLIMGIRKSRDNVQNTVNKNKQHALKSLAEKQALYYEAEWGLIFKDKLKISHLGVEYNGKTLPLDDITRVRWGAVRKSINYIPTGTEYTIVIHTDNDCIYLSPDGTVYKNFLDKLWKAVAGNIITNVLIAFRDGKDTGFDKNIRDTGVHYTKWNWFSKNEEIEYSWSQLRTGYHNGNLCLFNPDDKCILSFSLMDTDNAYMLDTIIQIAHEKKVKRLSDLLSKNEGVT